MLYKVVLTLSLWMKSHCVTNEIKAFKQYFHLSLFAFPLKQFFFSVLNLALYEVCVKGLSICRRNKKLFRFLCCHVYIVLWHLQLGMC